MALIGRDKFASMAERRGLKAKAVHQSFNFSSILVGAECVRGMSGNVQRQNVTTERIDASRGSADFHSRLQRRMAGAVKLPKPIGLHQANAATAFG